MKQADIDLRLKLIGTTRPKACPLDCPLHPRSKYHNPMRSGGFVPPKLRPLSKLLIVGIGPGEEEEQGREPFIGPSGRYASRALEWASGQEPLLVYSKINVVNCRTVKPGKQKSFINRTPPTIIEMRACYHAHLRPALRRSWACVAIFGADAYKFLVPTMDVRDGRSMKLFDVFGKAMGHRCEFDPEQHLAWYKGEDSEVPF
jgi:uracil-DNA glycosylase family 4